MHEGLEHLTEEEYAELRRIFHAQAGEILEQAQDLLLALESGDAEEDAVKKLQRHFHTLKGDSNSLGLTGVGAVCHRLEDVLQLIASNPAGAGRVTGRILGWIDGIIEMLGYEEAGTTGPSHAGIIRSIDDFISEAAPEKAAAGASQPQKKTEFTEYEALQARKCVSEGMRAYELRIGFHQLCAEKAVAAFMITERLGRAGVNVKTEPDTAGDEIEKASGLTALVCSTLSSSELSAEISIPGITEGVEIREVSLDDASTPHEAHFAGRKVDTTEARIAPSSNEMLRIDASKVDRLMDLVGELIIGRSIVDQIAKEIADGMFTQEAAARLLSAGSLMERTVRDLSKGVMKLRMVPVGQVFRRFPKIARDLAGVQGKKIRLDISGKNTELDKGIVDALAEPLAHIIRNMADHGIERPEERISAGKPEEGVISLNAYHEAAYIVIEASDDGRGINTGKLRKNAVEKAGMNEAEVLRLTDEEALSLIFVPGLSTADTLSDISGRGVGMDVVKSAVESMKGTISVDSLQGRGTRFTIRLPLTLAVIKALLFKAHGSLYAIPLSAVAEVSRVRPGDITTVNGKSVLMLRDRLISITDPGELFVKGEPVAPGRFAIILTMGGRKVGFLAESLSGQQELVMKSVDERYSSSGLVSGASILGDGSIVLILDPAAVFRKAVEVEKAGMESNE